MSSPVRLRYLLKERDERGHVDEPVLSVYRDHGVVPKESRSDNFNKTPQDLSNYKLVHPNDVVINKMKAWQGSVSVSAFRGIVSGDYLVCRITDDNAIPRYMHYLLRSHPLVGEYRRRSTGIRPSQWRLYWEDLADISVELPTPTEQKVAADFLDAETARIDHLVAKKRQLADSLRTRFVSVRSTVLSELAARNGSLSIRRCVQCLDGQRVPLNREERASRQGPYPYWGAGSVVDHIDAYLFDEEIVLLGEDGAPFFDIRRNVAFLVNERVWVNNHIHVLRPRPGWSGSFLRHCFNATDYGSYITGSTRDKLTQEEMWQIRIPCANEDEQRATSDALDREERRMVEAVSLLQHQIALLNEHRRSLITAAISRQLAIPSAS